MSYHISCCNYSTALYLFTKLDSILENANRLFENLKESIQEADAAFERGETLNDFLPHFHEMDERIETLDLLLNHVEKLIQCINTILNDL